MLGIIFLLLLFLFFDCFYRVKESHWRLLEQKATNNEEKKKKGIYIYITILCIARSYYIALLLARQRIEGRLS